MRVGAALLVALAAAGLAAATMLGAQGRTLTVPGAIAEISSERGVVAAAVRPPHGCPYVLTWKPSESRTHRVDCGDSDAVLQGLTLMGGVPYWWDYSTGNHLYCDDVYAGGRALGLCSGVNADEYYTFAGDRTLQAIVDWTVCEGDCIGPNNELLRNGNYSVEVRKVVTGKAVPLLAPVNFRVFLDARNARVATIEPKATLTVWDADGRKLWSLLGVTGVYGGWIDGSSVVLHQPRTIRVYTRSGAGTSRPLPRGADIVGVAGGLVVYAAGSTLRILRLSDGRDRRLFAVRGYATFTPAGIFWTRGSTLGFTPLGALLRKLR